MRTSPILRAAVSTAVLALCMFWLPKGVDWLQQPCLSVGGFSGKHPIEKSIDRLGGCFYLLPTRDGVVVRFVYFESDAELRRQPDVMKLVLNQYDNLYSVVWTTLPFRISKIEIQPKVLFDHDPKPVVMTRSALQIVFGPRPASLKFAPEVPLTDGAITARFAWPLAWALVLCSGACLITAAWRPIKARYGSKAAEVVTVIG
jgi:hypothetical protein